jgi:predicted 3-demethylubiquinone-9 3-methyltransferase (glyoxalase superfamily)
MTRITPFLYFEHEAEVAANYYVSLFADAKITKVSRYGEGGRQPAGTVITVEFTLAGQDFIALNGGISFEYTNAISFHILCSAADSDRLWDRLTADGGKPGCCGWLKDKFGVPWQVVPEDLPRLLGHPDLKVAESVTQAMLSMCRIDVAELHAAVDRAQNQARAA